MIRHLALALAFSALSTVAPVQAALPAPGGAKYDLNKNGIIDKGVELEVYLRHKASPILKEYDANLNGRLDAAEAEAINTKIENSDALIASRVDVADQLGEEPGLLVTAAPPKAEEERLADTRGILIRKAYEPISAFTLPGKFDKAGAALFSYKYDMTDGNDSGSASGVVAAYSHWNINTDYTGDVRKFRPTAAAIHGGVEFDQKLDQKNPSKEVDILTFRAGGEIEFSAGLFPAQFWRVSAFDTTSSTFESHVGGVEVEWEPVYNEVGIGNARSLGILPISYRWRPVLHGEIQSVLDSGGNASLAAQNDAYLFGPIVTAELWVEDGWLSGGYIDASYRYLFDAGPGKDIEYFDIGASYNLGQSGHYALTTRYRVGETPKARQVVEDITVGLGIKF